MDDDPSDADQPASDGEGPKWLPWLQPVLRLLQPFCVLGPMVIVRAGVGSGSRLSAPGLWA